MALSSAKDDFNNVFQSRFQELQSMFSTPSPADAALISSPDVQELLRKLEATSGGASVPKGVSSCAPCATLITPEIREAAKPCRGVTSWLLIALLLLGVFLVVYGVCQMFSRPRGAGRHAGARHKVMGAPHVGAGAVAGGAGPQGGQPGTVGAAHAGPGQGQPSDSLEETDPDQVIPSEPGVTFVFFHAPWCGHCKQFKPIYEALARSMAASGAKFKSVQSDVLQASKHADKVPIRGFPTVVAFKNGQQADSLVGNQGAEALKTFVSKNSA